MKIMVTGGAGFIGANLIRLLKRNGHTVTSIDNYDSGSISNHIEGIEYINEDILNIDKYENKYDVCFHLAALSRIQPSFKDPYKTFKINTEGTQKILDWALLNNTKVVYAGSSSKWHDPSTSPYATYKHLGEQICHLYRATYDLNVEICRFYNVYGPGEVLDSKWGAVIGIWRTQVSDKKPITIVGDGNQKRDFTHVFDIVNALYKVAITTKSHEDAWELGVGINYSINEVYNMFKKYTDIGCIYLEDQKGNYRETLRENNDTVEKLNWEPKDRLEGYIKSLYE
jgi:UDP-glucose 4-epimerase